METPTRPYVVGIAGGTGSGKTTVAEKLALGLPQGAALRLSQDSYYRNRPELSPPEREKINFDHPDAIETSLLVEQLDMLRQGRSIEQPKYDYLTHLRRDETTRVPPHPIIIVEGILLLADATIRERLDLKIFVDTDADVRILRRVHRDMKSRGRTLEQICEQYYATVRPMHLQFVEPSKRFADVIVPEGGNNHVALDMVLSKLRRVFESGHNTENW